MKRKSGLADSPFFTPVVDVPPVQSTPIFQAEAEPEENASKQANKQAMLQASNVASKQASLLAKLQELRHLKASNAATFRFPLEILEKLEEIEFHIRKTYKIKVTKNTIVVTALALLLFEFDDHQLDSSLYKYLKEQ